MLNNQKKCQLIFLILLIFVSISLLAAPESHAKRTLLLICPEDWQDSLQEYIFLREEQGWQVEVFSPGVNSFSSIHHQICCSYWRQFPVSGHLLLIGNQIPFAPQQLPGDFDYCLMDGPKDFFPDWICGRLPFSSESDLQNYLARLPENGRIEQNALLLDTDGALIFPEDCSWLFGPSANLKSDAAILFSDHISCHDRENVRREWQKITDNHSDRTCGEIFRRLQLEFFSQLPPLQAARLASSCHYLGDPTLQFQTVPPPVFHAGIKATRIMPSRLQSDGRIFSIRICFQLPDQRQDFFVIRESLPVSWQVQAVLWNQNPVQFARDESLLKILVQTDGTAFNVLEYQLKIPSAPGNIYSIRGNFLNGERLYAITGDSVLETAARRHVEETVLLPGWNLLCFDARLSPETIRLHPHEQFFQLNTSARCWIQCSLKQLRPEQGFWLFHSSEKNGIRLWLTDPGNSQTVSDSSEWILKPKRSADSPQWIWQNRQYRPVQATVPQGHGIWTRSTAAP